MVVVHVYESGVSVSVKCLGCCGYNLEKRNNRDQESMAKLKGEI